MKGNILKKTLCIVASHPLAKRFDFDRTDCDIWGFNEVMKQEWYKRADAIFQLHLEAIWRNPGNRNDPKHYKWLSSGNTPVIYMQDYYTDVPKSKKYPIDEIVAELLPNFKWISASGYSDNKYFSSSVCMAFALGIYKGYEKIECWGMEMNTDTEYRYQRDGLTFWQGIAVGRGIELVAYTEIYNAPVYGYEGEAEIDYKVFDQRIETLDASYQEKQETYNKAQAATDAAMSNFVDKFTEPENIVTTLKAQVLASFEFGIIDGAAQENLRYKEKAEKMKESAGGEFQFSRQEFEAGATRSAKSKASAETKARALAMRCSEIFEHAKKQKSKPRRRTVIKKLAVQAMAYVKTSAYVGLFTGVYQENENYLRVLDKLIKAAGGEKSEAVLLGDNNG